MSSDIPPQFLCPISHDVMVDPVLASDGQTYERSSIETWLRQSSLSPMTREPLDGSELTPNIALRQLIEDWKAERGIAVAPHPPAAAPLPSAHPPLTLVCRAAPQPESDETLVMLSAMPPADGKRGPCALICVLDVSGSMCNVASIPNDAGEVDGLTRLDLVKHSMRTILELLGDDDILAIVPFSGAAHVALPLTRMDSAGRHRAEGVLKDLSPDGMTNIWDAVRAGLELSESAACDRRNTIVLLLTDGEPTVRPPRGEGPTIARHIDAHPLRCTLHTFGFGYQLDSVLLSDVARMGNGSYSFIPDASFVGTVFINFMATYFAAAACRSQIAVEAMGGAEIVGVVGHEGNPSQVDLGVVQFGQSRDIVIRMRSVPSDPSAPYLHAALRFDGQTVEADCAARPTPDADVYASLARLLFVETVTTAMLRSPPDAAVAADLFRRLSSLPMASDPRVQALLRDISSKTESEGQVTKALSRGDWFTKWGRHYLPSLARAHMLQQCTNFKDPGVQVYGGSLFRELQGVADKAFCKLPPPKPSGEVPQVRGAGGRMRSAPRAPVQMSRYYNSSGPCFDGGAEVVMADGSVKRVDALRKGDAVRSWDGPARVVCVLQTVLDRPVPLVALGGMWITPWHPVFWEGKWAFPTSLRTPQLRSVGCIFNLVLERGHVATIGGVEVVTLGHRFSGDVIGHAYFGSDAVLADLRALPGWETGWIILHRPRIARDPQTNLMVGMTLS